MSNDSEVVIIDACRTPIGAFNGGLASYKAPELGAIVIKAIIERTKLHPKEVSEVIMGEVLTAGVGQAPTRQAALFAGLPNSVQCLTINKVCGSGLKAVMLAADALTLNHASAIIAGGMESMSNAPYLLEKARSGYRLGHSQLIDSMIKDGLWDVYNNFHMGSSGEWCAKNYNFSRKQQDAFAISSFKKALKAQKETAFQNELVPLDSCTEDEGPKKVNFEKIPHLKPVFDPKGTITAANASTLNDGASALLLMTTAKAKKLNQKPLAKIVAYLSIAVEPKKFPIAPQKCIEKLLQKNKMSVADIDLFEINEAFAVVNLHSEKFGKIPREKVNIHGGAIALGHPIGASGARILTTLIHSLKRLNKKRGLACICIGGGEASGMIVETT